MDKHIIVLANSKKYSNRCVAGIEVNRGENSNWGVVNNEGCPKWIRPVTNTEHGAIPTSYAQNIHILDVLEVKGYSPSPNGYQSENATYQTLRKVASIGLDQDNLNFLVDDQHRNIFGNHGKAVPLENVNLLSYSLMMIRVEWFQPFLKQYEGNSQGQLRGRFQFCGHAYDLPITDLSFMRDCNVNRRYSPAYLCISLGEQLKGWCYKLIAGVIIT